MGPLFISIAHTVQLTRAQLPEQRLNLGHSSESLNLTIRALKSSRWALQYIISLNNFLLQQYYMYTVQFSQFSNSVMSYCLWPHGLQRTRPPCPSPTPRACSNSCPLSRWCHPTISSSVVPFCSHLQSLPASGSFTMSQFFASGGQSIGVLASASVLPMNIQN